MAVVRVEGRVCPECEALIEEGMEGDPVYECSRCSGTDTERRCPECNIFMAKLADASCGECGEAIDLEDLELGVRWMAEDGSVHETELEASDWMSPDRVAERAAKDAAHKAEMDRYFEELNAENKRYQDEWLPRMTALMPKLHERIGGFTGDGYGVDREASRFLDVGDWILRTLGRYDGGHPSWMISGVVLMLLVGMTEEEQLAQMSAVVSYDLDHDEHRRVETELVEEMLRRLADVPGSEIFERSGGLWWGISSGIGFHIDAVVPVLEELTKE